MSEKPYYDDNDVKTILGIGESTLRKYLRGEVPVGTVNIKDAKPIVIGGKRRWNKSAIDKIDAGLPL